ncbi:MAG TPA: hypothetical protein VE338_10145 [Ktedonobacterales bacterium]|jgi:hypothetical protein|nr:hypothetical protein [Ktedonobacterales bacterium]
MTMRPDAPDKAEEPLADELVSQLQASGISAFDEVALRRELERHAPSYTLVRLTPAAARKWKARYRIMLASSYLDCQTVQEAYARALLALMRASKPFADSDATDA